MTEAEAARKLSEMLPRLYAWRLEIDKIEKIGAKDRTQPFPPASDADINAAESRRKFKFPPSYRAFLKLHNGWKNLSYDWWAFGVSGPGWDAPDKTWRSACATFGKRVGKKGTANIARLRTASKSDPTVMYWPDHVPCAADFTGGFMMFDRNRALAQGEYEIAEVAQEAEAANRLPDFVAFVDMIMEIMRDRLKEHGRNPNAIAAVNPGSVGAAPARPAVRSARDRTKPRRGAGKARKGSRT